LLKLISLATVVDLALILLAALVPQTHAFLPLGGTELSQLGAVLGGAVVLHGIYSTFI